MVCNRCIMVVKSELKEMNIRIQSVKLGEADILDDLDKNELEAVDARLKILGFELIDDKKSRIIEKIKNVIIEIVHNDNEEIRINYSDYLAEQLNYDYKYLSTLFSSIEGTTIEKYIIAQKIERVKELLVYDELSLSEISYKMGYSSVAHLSNQFKRITGLSPSHFKQIKENKRKPLDQVLI